VKELIINLAENMGLKKKEEATLASDLGSYRFGTPQRSGPMTMVPIFGTDHNGKFTYPRSGLKLSKVKGYGNMELSNPSATGVAIVPLHMGYIQDQAQNHALCRSAFIAAGQKVMFEDACCVQESQGGYLEGREQWFFILPLALREEALKLRGQKNYGKLWKAITSLNEEHGLGSRGHLEQILSRERAYLTQWQSRLELLPEQTGALFLIGDKLVGVEMSPSAGYFQEMWMPLVCFCYGTAAMLKEKGNGNGNGTATGTGTETGTETEQPTSFAAASISELRAQLHQSRRQTLDQIHESLKTLSKESLEKTEEERFLTMTLNTVHSSNFAGQIVDDAGRLVYASLFAKAN